MKLKTLMGVAILVSVKYFAAEIKLNDTTNTHYNK